MIELRRRSPSVPFAPRILLRSRHFTPGLVEVLLVSREQAAPLIHPKSRLMLSTRAGFSYCIAI